MMTQIFSFGPSAVGSTALFGRPPTTLTVTDSQAQWAPVWLFRLLDDGTGTTRRYATMPLDDLAAPYVGGILNGESLEIVRTLPNPLAGPVESQTVRVSLAIDAALTRAYRLGLCSRSVEIARYDRVAGIEWLEFSGIISHAEWARSRLELECLSPDLSFLQTLVPSMSGRVSAPTSPYKSRYVTADAFPMAVDVGAVIPVVFGNVPNVPLRYVRDDKVNSVFDYLVAHGTVSLTGAKRMATRGGEGSPSYYAMVPGEFIRITGQPATSWDQVARQDLYDGCTAVRVAQRQADSNNALFPLVANVTGFQAERNFVRAAAMLLSDPTWGLGRAVNAASVTAAAAQLPAELVCDGAMIEARQAQDWLRDLLMVRGIRLGLNAAGEFIFAVDTEQTTIRLVAHDGLGEGLRTILESGPRASAPTEDQLKALEVAYRRDYSSNAMTQTVMRVGNPAGSQMQRIEHAFLRDATAADMVVDYLAKRSRFGEESVPVALTQEARQLAGGDLVQVQAADLGYADAILETREVRKRLTRTEAVLQGIDRGEMNANATYAYHQIYQYEPGPAPADPLAGSEDDYSRTTPSAPTGLAILSSGTRVAHDGHVTAWVRLWWTTLAGNFDRAVVRSRVAGTIDWSIAGEVRQSGTASATIESLLPGTAYDYTVGVVNAFGLVSSSDPVLSSQTTPTDASVPSAPSGIAVRQSGAKVVEIAVTATLPADWGATRIYRNTTNNSATATEIIRAKAHVVHDENVVYGTTYYYWAKIEDRSANLSGFSPSSGHSITVIRLATADVSDNAITNAASAVNDGTNTVGTTEVSLQQITVTTDGGVVQLVAKAKCVGASGGDITLRFRKGSGTAGTIMDSAIGYATQVAFVPLMAIDNSPAASQTYTLTGQSTQNISDYVTNIRFSAINLKR